MNIVSSWKNHVAPSLINLVISVVAVFVGASLAIRGEMDVGKEVGEALLYNIGYRYFFVLN